MMQRFKLTLVDGSTHVVTRTIRAQVACETYFRANKRYGSFSESPFRALAFTAWSAAKSAGIVDVDFDQFLEATDPTLVSLLDVEGFDDDDDEEVEGLGEDTPADQFGN